MELSQLSLPTFFHSHYTQFTDLTPIQEKAVHTGLLQEKSLLICAPTASGKTLIATMAICNVLANGKALYIVPLRALASEKFKEYQRLLAGTPYTVMMSTGDVEAESDFLAKYNLLILTVEKLDSLFRHRVSWLSEVKVVVIDEIHLLNDTHRGPTLEIIITLLRMMISCQLIGLSATIGNPEQLAAWLKADLVIDDWRPVELKKGICYKKEVEFY